MSRALFAISLGLALPLGGCLRPAEERARLDEQVGAAFAGGVHFQVRDGLAAVREASDGTLVLWSQSPVIQLELETTASATEDWSLLLLNSMPGSRLRELGSSEDVEIEPLDAARPTVSSHRVRLPRGIRTTLQWGPDDLAATAPFSFAVLSDIQSAIDDVEDVWAVMNADPELRFVASTGDLSERGSGEELDRVQRSFDGLAIPFYSTLGNHELGGDPLAWHQRFGRGSFHWAFRGVHMTFLDSANAGIDPTVYGWLRGWLAEGRQHAHLVFTHFPPFDPVGTRSGSFRDRNEASLLVSLLAQGRVDSTFHGHVHSYYSFSLGGIPAWISGGGGAIPERMDGVGRHYLRVTVDPSTQRVDVSVQRVD